MAMKIINKIKISDIPIISALALLACAPLLLVQNQGMVANEIAKYAYYLLVIGIVWKVVLYLLTRKNNKMHLSDVK